MLKRTLGGTYISVEPLHLFRYTDEQAFCFNNRSSPIAKAVSRKLARKDTNDRGRFELAARNVAGKRVTYQALTHGAGSATSH